jgi:hypothetical protein
MDLSGILGFAIGVIAIFLALSLLASGIKEYMAGAFAWRGKYLSRTIALMLEGMTGDVPATGGIGPWLTSHFSRRQTLPPQASPITAADILEHPLVPGSASRPPSYIDSKVFASALLNLLDRGSQAPTFETVRAAVTALPDGGLKTTLLALLADGAQDLDSLRARIERWFDATMDRLQGVYQRFARYMLLLIGLVLAVALNVDSFRVANSLWQTPALRDGMARVAGDAITQLGPATSTPSADPQASVRQASSVLQAVQATQLPIGWQAGVRSASWFSWTATLFGWLITACAVSLGAPFWFNLLQDLLSLRASGPKPPASGSS